MNLYISTIRQTIRLFPAVVPHLKGRARWAAFTRPNRSGGMMFANGDGYYWDIENKTYDYFLFTLTNLIESVYRNDLGGEFIDITAALIYGQLDQAYRLAWKDEGDDGEFPQYLQDSFEDMYLNQFDFVDAFYRAIVDARIDQTPIDPLLARAALWANRYNEAYNQAVLLIKADNGENLEWVYGDDIEEHCPECAALNGIVARGSDWQSLNVHPQNAPNDKLSCQGWRCGCTLEPTDKRRSPKAMDSIIAIVSK